MRLEVTFRPIKGRVLPWDYPVHIHKFIYDLLRKQGLEKLHDEGISPPGDGSLRSYGPFTFALVCPQAKGEEEGLIFSKRILLYIATGLEEVSEALFEELSLPIEFQVGSVRCVREGLKELEDVELPDDVILRAKSPICLSTAVDDENGEMRKKYIDPEESKDEFMRVGRENLAWKSKAFGYDVKPEEIEFEPVGEHD